MSAEARMLSLIEDTVRRETGPLREAVDALSARLAALEGSSGPSGAAPAKRPAAGRTAKAKAQPAESAATAEQPADAVPSPRRDSDA